MRSGPTTSRARIPLRHAIDKHVGSRSRVRAKCEEERVERRASSAIEGKGLLAWRRPRSESDAGR